MVVLQTSARRVKRLFKRLEAEGQALPVVQTRERQGSHKKGALEVYGDREPVMQVARLVGGILTSWEG